MSSNTNNKCYWGIFFGFILIISTIHGFSIINNSNTFKNELSNDEELPLRDTDVSDFVYFPWNWSEGLTIDKYFSYGSLYSLWFYLQSDLTFTLELPVYITVDDPLAIHKGGSKNVDIDLYIPFNQARWTIDFNLDFVFYMDLLNDYFFDFTYIENIHRTNNFSTPLGTQQSPFQIEFPIDVSGIGELNIIGIPEITETVTCEYIENPNFIFPEELLWESAGTKETVIMAKFNATSGSTSITIGNWKYHLYFSIRWLLDFDFYINEINDFVEQYFSTNMDYELGLFPENVHIGYLGSPDEISFPITIAPEVVNGSTPDTSINLNLWEDKNYSVWYDAAEFYQRRYYTFFAETGGYYEFSLDTNGSLKNMAIQIYDGPFLKKQIRGISDDLRLNFTSTEDKTFSLSIECWSGSLPHKATWRVIKALYPGISKNTPKILNYPYSGDYNYLNRKNNTSWYTFNASIGEEIVFWCDRYNKNNSIDMKLYHETSNTPYNITLSPINETLGILQFDINISGTYYLELNGTLEDSGYYWLDYSKNYLNLGDSIEHAISFNNSYTTSALGLNIETHGGIWFKTNISIKTRNTFTFTGTNNSYYIYHIYNATDFNSIHNGSNIYNKSTFEMISFIEQTLYILIIPVYGGFNFTINKTSEIYYYIGEHPSTAISINSNYNFNATLPVPFGDELWVKSNLHEYYSIYTVLKSKNSTNCDIYLYSSNGSTLLNSSTNSGAIDSIHHTFSSLSSGTFKITNITQTGNFTLNIYILPIVDFLIGTENQFQANFSTTQDWEINHPSEMTIDTINKRMEWDTNIIIPSNPITQALHPTNLTMKVGDVISFGSSYINHSGTDVHRQCVCFGLRGDNSPPGQFSNDNSEGIFFYYSSYNNKPRFRFYISTGGSKHELFEHYDPSYALSSPVKFFVRISILDSGTINFALWINDQLNISEDVSISLAEHIFPYYGGWNQATSASVMQGSYEGWGTTIYINESTWRYKSNAILFTENSQLFGKNITNYQWDFGDSLIFSTAQNPIKTYNTSWSSFGSIEHNYTITLTVTDELGFLSSKCRNITIIDRYPYIYFSSKFFEPLTYNENTVKNGVLEWIVRDPDLDPGEYNIYRNGTLILENQSWEIETEIEYNLTSLSAGNYEFKIRVWDEQGIYIEETILVIVNIYIPPQTTTTSDIPGFEIIFILICLIGLIFRYIKIKKSNFYIFQ